MARRWRKLLLLAFVVLLADQTTKFWAAGTLTRLFESTGADGLVEQVQAFFGTRNLERMRRAPMVVVEDYFHFHYVENPGAAWGTFGRMRPALRIPFFYGVTLLAVGLILSFFRRLPEQARSLQTALALVLGGALGNFVDRAARGYVVDFIDWHWKGRHWPTFNVADVAISIGVAVLVAHALFARHPLGDGEAEQAPGNRPLDAVGSEGQDRPVS